MRLERLSLRTLVIVSLVALAGASVLHTVVAKLQFRNEAVNYRVAGLSRLIEIATQEVLRHVRDMTGELAHSLQADASDWLESPEGGADELAARLNGPFRHALAGTGKLELAKVRMYDADLQLVAESSLGMANLSPHLPALLRTRAHRSTGSAPAEAPDALWMSPQGLLYSVLVPLEGPSARGGYLEVVVAPLPNLREVGKMIRMPFSIHAVDAAELKRPREVALDHPIYYPAEYVLRGDDGAPALRLVAYEDMQTLYKDMHQAQLRVTSWFLAATALGLGLLLWLLNKYLFRPMHAMIDQMEHCIHGEPDTRVDEHGIKEVRQAARAFNIMVVRVRESVQDLQRLSALDSLTGIANRRHFDTMLQKEWQRALRNDTSIALLLMDIDFFKLYNDGNGHQAGDQCIKEVATAIRTGMQRPGDLVARYGGEEFVVLLPETDIPGALRVARRIKSHVAQLNLPHEASSISDRITLSIGVCVAHAHTGMDASMLVAAADAALYRAKRHGRDRIELASQEDIAVGKAVRG